MGSKKRDQTKKFTYKPFGKLVKTQKSKSPVKPRPEPEPRPKAIAEPQDDEMFYDQAMADVKPLADDRSLVDKKARARPMITDINDEELVMRHLDDLVHGDVEFDIADTDEYIEGCKTGFDRRVLGKLRRGELSYQAFVDLHGLDRKQAREKVWHFLDKSVKQGLSCVLIVHGRGLGSKDNIPVLKTKLTAWLTRGAMGKRVLAFTSARPYDGGTGALYVLLKRGYR